MKYAVVGLTTRDAELCKEVFGLSERWEAYGLTESVQGRGFARVVILRPRDGMSADERVRFERDVQHWSTRLFKFGTLRVI